MFKTLREKFTSWFKKSEEKPKTKAKKEKKEKPIKKKTKQELAKETKQVESIKIQEEQTIKEHIKEEKAITQELKEELKKIKEEKQGFFKRIFSKKKPEAKQIETQADVKIKTQLEGPIPSFPEDLEEEKPGFFAKLAKKLSVSILTQEQFDKLFQELEIILLENNVALETVDKIRESLSKDLVGISVKKTEVQSTIISSLKESINSIIIESPSLIEQIKKKQLEHFTIIFFGINGSGKTTSIAKLSHFLKKHNISCVLAAADTFRAASIEQLKIHAEKLNLPIVAHQYGSDPASVAFDAKKYAEAHNIKVVLIDTAGRMYTKTNLLKEMEKIVRISQPDLKLFIGESITGNDVIEQAKTFNEAIGIDGIILTKADVDEKAGTILSISQVTGKPIYFLGTGQNYEDLAPFKKEEVLKNLGLE